MKTCASGTAPSVQISTEAIAVMSTKLAVVLHHLKQTNDIKKKYTYNVML